MEVWLEKNMTMEENSENSYLKLNAMTFYCSLYLISNNFIVIILLKHLGLFCLKHSVCSALS